MNIAVAVGFLVVALLLPFKPLALRCAAWLLSLASWRLIAVGGILLALPLLIWGAGIADWYFYSARIALFVIGLLLMGEGLYILMVDAAPLQKLLRFMAKHYYLIAIPMSLICLLLSIFILARSYIGPIPDVSSCKSGSTLSVSCVVSNPEDMVITPDNRFILLSEFGGSGPLNEAGPGNLALVDAQTKLPVPLAIIYSDNTWGDGQCVKTADSPFGPHGIDLVERTDGRHQLAVVNHMGGESIEMFELVAVDSAAQDNAPRLTRWGLVWRGCVVAPEENFINDVSLLSDGSFFVSHMYSHKFTTADFLYQLIAKQDTGYVLHWDDHTGFSQVPGTEGSQPNGLVFDQASNILYVAFNIADKLSAIDVITGQVLHSFYADALDNLVLDQGNLWLTSLDHAVLDVLVCEENSLCPLPFTVTKLDANSLTEIEHWSFTQQPFGLPSVAMPFQTETLNQVIVGTFMGDRLAYFDVGLNLEPTLRPRLAPNVQPLEESLEEPSPLGNFPDIEPIAEQVDR